MPSLPLQVRVCDSAYIHGFRYSLNSRFSFPQIPSIQITLDSKRTAYCGRQLASTLREAIMACMNTRSADFRNAVDRLPDGAALVIQGLRWEDYEGVLEDVRNRPRLRVSYVMPWDKRKRSSYFGNDFNSGPENTSTCTQNFLAEDCLKPGVRNWIAFRVLPLFIGFCGFGGNTLVLFQCVL